MLNFILGFFVGRITHRCPPRRKLTHVMLRGPGGGQYIHLVEGDRFFVGEGWAYTDGGEYVIVTPATWHKVTEKGVERA